MFSLWSTCPGPVQELLAKGWDLYASLGECHIPRCSWLVPASPSAHSLIFPCWFFSIFLELVSVRSPPTPWDVRFRLSPMSAVLDVLPQRGNFLIPQEGMLHPAWMDQLGSDTTARSLVPAASSDTEASLSLHLFLPFSSNYGALSYWLFLFLFSPERDNHCHTALQPALVSASKILEDLLGKIWLQLPKEGPGSFNLGACYWLTGRPHSIDQGILPSRWKGIASLADSVIWHLMWTFYLFT